MKTFKSLIILTLALIVGVNNAIAGNSDETQVRKVEGFNAIKVSTGIDLYLKMGSSEEVKIVADDDIIDNLKTEVKDGTLHIYMKKNNWFNWGGNQTRKAYVTVNELVALHASSGADVRTENTIKGESLAVKASSGSDVVLDIFYKNLSVDTSSGSDATISGKAKTFKAESSSGSDIKAKDLEAKIGKLSASSGSDITATITDELYARASSGSDIKYYGNPQIRDTDESSGGDVRHK
ncbi:DUF2807 domain-containing protein [Prolixibacteraceae bacterium Z1-6]|uniref:DUF2807 domain-containing protein n=1 Tax=Draconibacterium aestuarii TaxID=2998507 RepID=A0A9X3F5U9_9BACT|nr:DUF2807 domain-containing protein [Prolixibacteraceae bacterium Z1-6]